MNLCLGLIEKVTTLFEALESLDSSEELLDAGELDAVAELVGLSSRSLGARVVEVVVVVDVVDVVLVVLVVLVELT